MAYLVSGNEVSGVSVTIGLAVTNIVVWYFRKFKTVLEFNPPCGDVNQNIPVQLGQYHGCHHNYEKW